MTTRVFRIGFRGAVSLDGLDFGALRWPGRWHTPRPGARRAVVYTAGSRALAQLEKRVHANGVPPVDQSLLRLDVSDGATLLDAFDLGLSPAWRESEGYTQGFGNRWFAAGASLGLWVPSYVEARERNLLLCPEHPQYATHVALVVEVADFQFDPRLYE